ncbi:MAG: aminopeptidase N [Alcanivorax sp. Nap_24]|nr:MAG: aminopeptidase N [Alcanivorax sp. Nap_24]
MRDGNPAPVTRLTDYRPPAWLVDHTRLDVDLRDGHATVTAELTVRRNPALDDRPGELVLDGEHLELLSLSVDDRPLGEPDYRLEEGRLTVPGVPEQFTLTSKVRIHPESNTALEGLYRSNGMYCTQCEAEGFRRITFFPDRPDVLSRFTTTIHADRAAYPLLLSNGNPVDSGDEEGGRHFATWDDPFPKPCYLFALVAGDLACLEDSFRTASGRDVALRLYAEHRDLDKLGHAMDSLKRAMAWDEQVFGREYDLDIFQVVAVSHFNMGAMENKGLNIFNTSCVLAHPATTTDAGFERVESVVAHEYFHNWSGNRVTCRDWFQLSLKEGFTVFRDQEFSSDMNSRAVTRVENVDFLVNHQFPEDQGPMAHPVRPSEYQKIDNFYTLTVYEKGSEIVRMQHELLGAEDFRRASDLYFERFDGQAVTCDDFVACMEEVSGLDLSQFKRWYSQAGTPLVTASDRFADGEYQLTLRQETPPTPGQSDKQPLMIPVKLALLDDQGRALPLDDSGATETVVILRDSEQTFRFPVATDRIPTPSLLRGFSAPVSLRYPFKEAQLITLLAHDSDGFCRWDAAQRLYFAALARIIDDGEDAAAQLDRLTPVLEQVIQRAGEDPAEAALLLTLPTETAVGDRHTPLRPQAVHDALSALRAGLGEALAASWWRLVEELAEPEYRADGEAMGKRRLRQVALAYLSAAAGAGRGDRDKLVAQLQAMLDAPTCMTEELGALRALVHNQLPGAEPALAAFAQRWRDEALVMDQWFAVQATVPGADTVARAEGLLAHDAFEWTLPNRVRAVVGTLVNGNPSAFHAPDGSGYAFFARALKKLDGINPQIAARLANGAARLQRLEPALAEQLGAALRELRPAASANLAEVLDRIL